MNGFSWLLDRAWDWPAKALVLAGSAAGSAALFAALAATTNLFCRRWLSARQMGLLWGLVLVRLMLPFAPGSSFSLQRLLPSIQVQADQPGNEALPPDSYYDSPYESPDSGYSTAPLAPDAAPGDGVSSLEDSLILILPLAWLLGAVATLLGAVMAHRRFCQGLQQVFAGDDARLSGLWKSCCQLVGVRRDVPVLLTDSVDQPAVMGIFRPSLLLPYDATQLQDEQLRMVMLHELAHMRRWHVAANWALVLIRALHWWNPVYWLAAGRFESLREQACDAFAIQRLGGRVARDYGDLLLSLAARQQPRASWQVALPVSLLGLFSAFFRKRAMQNRLGALRTAGAKQGRWHTTAVTMLVVLAAACGLTDASTSTPAPELDWLPICSWNHWDAIAETATGEPVTRTYDVAKVLQRIAEDERTLDAASILKWQIIAQLGGYEPEPGHPTTARVKPGYERKAAVDGAMLTVDAPPGVHAEIERNLATWEKGGMVQLCVETRFITDERDIASALGISWQYLEASEEDRGEALSSESRKGGPTVHAESAVFDYLPVTVASLRSDQVSRLIEAVQKGRCANLLQAPKVTLINGQRASMFHVTHTPFVVGLKKGEGGPTGKVEVVDEGIKLTLRAIHERDASSVRLEARTELSEITDIHAATALLAGEPRTFQLPRVKRSRIHVCSEIPDGDSLLVGCLPTYEQKRFFYVLLTVRKLSETVTE